MKTKNEPLFMLTPLKTRWLAIVCALMLCLPGLGQLTTNRETGNMLKLTFNNVVAGKPFALKQDYTNSFGETYSVVKFRYYITQIQMIDSSNMSVQFFPDDYFLIDAGDSSTRTLNIPLSLKHLSYISFLVGVDSAANVGGTQQGALDPANGMFWAWNTGYVMAKLQGVSPAAKSPAHAFTFDVGGFKPGENATRKIEFVLNPTTKRSKSIHSIVFNVDIDKWFNGSHPIKIAEHPGCHEAGQLAMQLADNYQTMFSIESTAK